MNIVVVDDNKKLMSQHIDFLHREIRFNNESMNIDAFSSFSDAISSDKKYDIALIDIELPDGNGLELARRYYELNRNIGIIVISGYDKYVFDSFEAHVFRYLLKPTDSNKLKKALFDFYYNFSDLNRTISVPLREKSRELIVTYIRQSEIIYVEASGKNSVIKLSDNSSLTTTKGISALEEELDRKHFYRIHRGIIVNLDKVTRIKKDEVGVSNGDVLPIRRNMAVEFAKTMNNYILSLTRDFE